MNRSGKLAAAGVAGLLALIIIAIIAAWPRAAPQTLPAPAIPAGEIAPAPPRPVPAALASGYREIHDLLRAGRHPDAASRFPPFLSELARQWGAGSNDLAPYHYDFALALKLAGRPRQCLEVSRQAYRLWPRSLQLEVLFLTTAAEAALAQRVCPSEVEEGLKRTIRPENAPRLRGLRIDPASLHALRARLLESAGRSAEALGAADEGLRLEGRHPLLREVRARALLALERSREAAEVLRDLVAEKSNRERELLLGSALLGCGKAAEACGIFSRLLGEGAPGPDRTGDGAPGRPLRLLASRALLEMGRTAEAREHLRDVLLEEPESLGALQLLASTLGPPAREAIQGRIRELLSPDRSLAEAQKAEAAGFASSAHFHRAEAALRLDRAGEALARLEEAVRLSPRLAPLRVELARVGLFLGRADLSERVLREGLQLEASPLLSFELARTLGREGRSEEARQLLGGEAPAGGPVDSAAAMALAGCWLELGEPARARSVLATAGGEGAEEKPLLLAEAALIEGRDGEAGDFLAEGAGPGFFAALRARALRAILDLRRNRVPDAEPDGNFDPSDLLDEPRLLSLSGAAALREARGRLAEVHRSLRGRSGEETVDGYRRLFYFYSDLRARRKARESAWVLLQLRQNGPDELRLVARTLSRPEDLVTRMSLLSKARKVLPGDGEIEGWWREGSAFLGWDPR